MSSSGCLAAKLKLIVASIGSYVMTGLTRSAPNAFRTPSLAFALVDAMSSWIARARCDASRSFVGVFIRSISATRTPSATSRWEARRTRDDFP